MSDASSSSASVSRNCSPDSLQNSSSPSSQSAAESAVQHPPLPTQIVPAEAVAAAPAEANDVADAPAAQAAEAQAVPQLFDEDPDLYDAEEPPVKKQRGKNRDYMPTKYFEKKESFDEWWQTEQDKWRIADRHSNSGADADFYRCKFSKRANYACQMMLRVDYAAHDESVIVSVSEGDHDHNQAEPTALSEPTKALIRELSDAGLMPMRILNTLRNRKVEPLPTLLQVQNVVKRANQAAGPSTKFTVHDLRQHCEEMIRVPDGFDDPYVLRFDIENGTKFSVVWTTRRLLGAQLQSKLLQLDSTAKLNYHGYPVQVAGFSDANHRFNGTMLSLSYSEDTWSYSKIMQSLKDRGFQPEVVLADGAQEITAACRSVFPAARRAMCWAHVLRQVDKRLASFDKAVKHRLRDDLKLLQYARTDREFEIMARHLFESWPGETQEFAEYVRQQWVDSPVRYWFEGSHGYCATNNGLESVNKQLKQGHTMRRLVGITHFLRLAKEIVNGWSTTMNQTRVALKPTIKPHVFRDAYHLSKSGRVWRKSQGVERYVFASGDSNVQPEQLAVALEKCVAEFGSFEEFKANRFKVYIVERHPSGGYYQCTCPVGSKKGPCKHSTMIACHPTVALETYPPDAVSEELTKKKKTGRPSEKKSGRPRLAGVQNRFAVAN